MDIYEILGLLASFGIVGYIIKLSIYWINRNKKIKVFKNISKTYSTDLMHYMIDTSLDYSYGRAEINLQFENDSNYDKSIGINELEFRTLNYKSIEFSNIMLDYSLDSSEKIIGGNTFKANNFLLYAINNSINQNDSEVTLTYYGDDQEIDIGYPQNLMISLKGGQIKRIIKLDLSNKSLINLFINKEYKVLNIRFEIDDEVGLISIRFVNDKFVFYMGQFGAGGPPTRENVQDLLIENNSSDFNNRLIKIESNTQENFTLKLFSPRSAKFLFEIILRGELIYSTHIVIYIPVYNQRDLKRKILHFDQYSKFMIKNNIDNYNIEEKFYDTSSLKFYDYRDYFENNLK